MSNWKVLPAALAAGALAGALVLGLLGRVATAGIAVAVGRDLNLSLRGILEVFALGLVVGGVGGLFLVPVRRLFPASRAARDLLLGVALFAASFLVFLLQGGAVLGGLTLLTTVVVAGVYVLYAYLTDALLARFQPGGPPRRSGARG